MKDNGIEWIGDIPREWTISKMKHIGQYINGYAFKPSDWASTGRKIIRIQDLTKSTDNPNYYSGELDNRYLITKGDVLVSWAATLDTYIWEGEDGWLNQHIFKAIPNYDIINPSFFFWLIKEAMWNMNNDNKHGIVMQHVTFDVFGNFSIPLPPMNEQKRIASFLDKKCAEIDSLSEKTRESIEEYKKLKQAVITEAVTKGVRGKREMKDSGVEWIGEMPKEWCTRKLKTFATQLSKGATPKDIAKDRGEEHSIRYIKSENIVDNRLSAFPEFYIDEDTHFGELSRSNLSINDILFVIAGASIGKVAVMDMNLLPSNTNQAVCFIRVKDCYKSLMKYLWYALQSDLMKTYVSLFSVQSAQPNISMENLSHFKLPYTENMEEIDEIITHLDKKIAEIDALISKKEALLEELDAYKKSLIYEYVTGKKRL